MKEANRLQNDGILRDDATGEPMADSAKSQKGVTPPPNEVQVDHVKPVSKGGTRSNTNLQLRTRKNNRSKSNNI
jgi:filamentous hemagglutinin